MIATIAPMSYDNTYVPGKTEDLRAHRGAIRELIRDALGMRNSLNGLAQVLPLISEIERRACTNSRRNVSFNLPLGGQQLRIIANQLNGPDALVTWAVTNIGKEEILGTGMLTTEMYDLLAHMA